MNTETLKELANANITLIFDALHLEYSNCYTYYSMKCPVHKGENLNFSWVKDQGYWRCFSKHCEKKVGSDIYSLVQQVKNCSFKKAVEIIKSIVITSDYVDSEVDENDLVFQKFLRENTKKKKTYEIYDPALIKKLKPDFYFKSRGFSDEVVKSFQCGYCDDPDKPFYRRAIIPVFNHDELLIGFTGRATFDYTIEKRPKWMHSPQMPASETLFNLFRAKKSIKETESAILVEGPLDVMRFEMAGKYNSVALFGTNLSGPQRSLLLKYGCKDMYLAFDGDTAGNQCTNQIIQSCKNYFNLYVYVLPEGKDIGDLSVEEIKSLPILKAF